MYRVELSCEEIEYMIKFTFIQIQLNCRTVYLKNIYICIHAVRHTIMLFIIKLHVTTQNK